MSLSHIMSLSEVVFNCQAYNRLATKDELQAILDSPYYSYLYSKAVLKSRFIDAEQEIAKNSSVAYLYAKDVLKGRFELGEKAISENANNSYEYAKNILKNRFYLGEKTIAEKPSVAIDYAKHVIKGRFEIAEKKISSIALYALSYVELIKERFELLEDSLLESKDFSLCFRYLKLINNVRIKKIEPIICKIHEMYVFYNLKFDHS